MDLNYICLELLREKFLPRELLLIEATTTHCMRYCWRNIHAITNCMKTVKTALTLSALRTEVLKLRVED